MKSFLSHTLLTVVVLSAAMFATANAKANQSQTILSIAESTPELSTLVTLVKQAGLDDVLNSAGPFTVFAPTNDGFMPFIKIPSGADLKDLLLFHVAAGEYTEGQLACLPDTAGDQEGRLFMANGKLLQIDERGAEGVTFDTYTRIIKTIRASNGIIHIIDNVLIEPNI